MTSRDMNPSILTTQSRHSTAEFSCLPEDAMELSENPRPEWKEWVEIIHRNEHLDDWSGMMVLDVLTAGNIDQALEFLGTREEPLPDVAKYIR